MSINTLILPAVPLTLVGLDGNAFAVLGAFRRAAKQAGWTPEQIAAVAEDAISGNYDHLLATIMEHCENGGLGETDDF